MKRFLVGTMMTALLAAPLAFAADPNDAVVEAGKIAPSTEATFARDGKLSPFWSAWETGQDYANLTTTANAWVSGTGTFSGADDAGLKIKAAYGENALYLLFEVTDNDWQPPAGYDADALDFLIDKMSSQEIRDANPFDAYIQPSWLWSLTFSSIQYQVGIGGASLPTTVQVNYFDGAAMYWGVEPLENLATAYGGMDLDIVDKGGANRALEVKIPWAWVGTPSGSVGSVPPEGTRVALAGGYNDLDAGETGGRTLLRWKEKDPFNSCTDMTPPHDYCDSWGDIQMGGQAPVPVIHGQGRVQTGTAGAVVATSYYTIKGEKLTGNAASMLKTGTMIVKKETLGSGAIRSQMVRTY